jgi:glyoxylase-like metal-dependent hydrolase (beta-lactamase superfamily II)
MRVTTIDLQYQGAPGVVAVFLVEGPGGPILIETGPCSTLPVLLGELKRLGVKPSDVRDILVTHIHLDHAGAAGWWAQQGANVHVHTVGAPHLVDPTKLLQSATRIYGDRMHTLWGDTVPAPAERVFEVKDGATLRVGGLEIHAIATPGHAWHHHAYRIDDIAFTGDSAGIQLAGCRWIDLPAPPPEFNLDAWRTSLEKLRGLGLRTLYRTHFGPGVDAAAELDTFETVLETASTWILEMMREGVERDGMVATFTDKIRKLADTQGLDPALFHAYEVANPRDMTIDGIARYWRKRMD